MTSATGGVSAGETTTWACPAADAPYLRQNVESRYQRNKENIKHTLTPCKSKSYAFIAPDA
uniref:Uncharacterized protein n=1 Tax=Setaria italica TaxID=4555 RepID=K3ZFW7_SETIT